jgi:hypothetical protein
MDQISRKPTNFGFIFNPILFFIFIVTGKLNNLLVISSQYPHGKNAVEPNPKKE